MKTEVKRKRVKAKNRVRVTKINYVINPESKGSNLFNGL